RSGDRWIASMRSSTSSILRRTALWTLSWPPTKRFGRSVTPSRPRCRSLSGSRPACRTAGRLSRRTAASAPQWPRDERRPNGASEISRRSSRRLVADEITLTIPRDPEFHRVAHLVLGGLAVRLDLTIENLEDLEIALDAILDRTDPDAGEITIRMSL